MTCCLLWNIFKCQTEYHYPPPPLKKPLASTPTPLFIHKKTFFGLWNYEKILGKECFTKRFGELKNVETLVVFLLLWTENSACLLANGIIWHLVSVIHFHESSWSEWGYIQIKCFRTVIYERINYIIYKGRVLKQRDP